MFESATISTPVVDNVPFSASRLFGSAAREVKFVTSRARSTIIGKNSATRPKKTIPTSVLCVLSLLNIVNLSLAY